MAEAYDIAYKCIENLHKENKIERALRKLTVLKVDEHLLSATKLTNYLNRLESHTKFGRIAQWLLRKWEREMNPKQQQETRKRRSDEKLQEAAKRHCLEKRVPMLNITNTKAASGSTSADEASVLVRPIGAEVLKSDPSLNHSVPSLFTLCRRSVNKSIGEPSTSRDIPISLLQPVLTRFSSERLFRAEIDLPYLCRESDEIWASMCRRDFPNSQKLAPEDWRDAYRRLELSKEMDDWNQSITRLLNSSQNDTRANSSSSRRSAPETTRRLSNSVYPTRCNPGDYSSWDEFLIF